MEGSISQTSPCAEQEDHGFIIFDSQSKLYADYSDSSTVSSLSLSLGFDDEDEEPPFKRARLDSHQASSVPTEISDDNCFRTWPPTNDDLGLMAHTSSSFVLSATSNDLKQDISRKPSSLAQGPVPDPMIPLNLPPSAIPSNPQCAMQEQSPELSRSYSKTELNMLLDTIEKAFVNNATKTMGVLEIMRRSGLNYDPSSKRAKHIDFGYMTQRHQVSNSFDQGTNTATLKKSSSSRIDATTVPNPLANHEHVPPVIQVPCSPLGLSAEANDDDVSELGLDDQYPDRDFRQGKVSKTEISNAIHDVLNTPALTILPSSQIEPTVILVSPSVE